MNQNNSAQPGLTDDLKDAVDILRALRGYLKSHRINGPTMLCTDGKALNNADDEVLRALKLLVPLSKLRAPVADERAAELMEEARSEGHSSVAAYVDQLKTSAATYRQERNSARDAVARYREESTTRAPVADERPAQEYGSPADVAQRIEQYLAHDGRMNSGTQLLYEAMKALRGLPRGSK
ncbi:hypothetical protein ACOTH0_15470 [Achromobacter xylosoxidans]